MLMEGMLVSLLLALRSHWALYLLAQPDTHGSIAYEYEKNSYPLALADVLAGNQADQALAFLQQPDPEADATLGIDLYSSFVLKLQIRKYFAFGDELDPAYRDRMFQAMAQLTATDPLEQEAASPRKFWSGSTDDCTTQVDCRNTDNLRAMRETSLYLIAEETGNEATRQIYKAHLERYVSTLLDIGMGEWDSPTYHGHTTTAYLNLYDFAQDPEVKQLAQSALDWLFHSAALKYWRGTWTGPVKRPGGTDAERFFWLYFGQGPSPETTSKDWIHGLTSDYRPPAEVMAIAQRQIPLPQEIRRTHPHYENWLPDRYGPAFYETLYLAHSFQLGSLLNGTGGDWQGFSLAVAQGQGVDQMRVEGGGQQAIAQYKNLLIWQGTAPPQLTLPAGTQTQVGDITFIETEQAWIALWRFDNGFALEIGESQTHGDFETFRDRVIKQSELQSQGPTLVLRGSLGKRLALRSQGEGRPTVWRDGQPVGWETE
ncbi:MAG: hypothetical protein O2890_08180 [Cyanobacteria bacterium]|nr:hypothetical protein [Cyanobacteriota bacterium]MDA0866383.1 hypothetical protein [Cyanobacteriota bacterium]